jgi:hypothetical protein
MFRQSARAALLCAVVLGAACATMSAEAGA